ncbi:MAG: DUF3611 family protein [Pseudomonadota bacterium]
MNFVTRSLIASKQRLISRRNGELEKSMDSVWIEDRIGSLGASLQRLGTLAFWVQLVFLVVVVLLSAYTLTVTGGLRATTGNFLAFLALALPIFTTYWVKRYAGTGKEMTEGGCLPSVSGLKRQLWTGVWAGTIGSGASLVSLFGAASALLFTMLANPQIGIQVSPATGTAGVYTISAIDGVSIMTLLLTLTAELLVIFVSLRLIFLTEYASQADSAT